MSQSQNAIFTSPTGEENLMNSNHRDSESITGEFTSIMLRCYFSRTECKCLSLTCVTCLDKTPASLSSLEASETNWMNHSIPWSPIPLSKSAFCGVLSLCHTPIYSQGWAGILSEQHTCVFVPTSVWTHCLAHKRPLELGGYTDRVVGP